VSRCLACGERLCSMQSGRRVKSWCYGYACPVRMQVVEAAGLEAAHGRHEELCEASGLTGWIDSRLASLLPSVARLQFL